MKRARGFLKSGKFLWNSGMFLFGATRYLQELHRHAPKIFYAAQDAVTAAASDLDFVRLDKKAFAASPALSVDYAVMEKTKSGAVVKSRMKWSDVGSWSELWEVSAKDKDRNAVRGDVSLRDAKGNYVSAGSRHVSLLGVEDLVIVETDDAVLVAVKGRAQEVKEVVAQLDRQNRTEHVSALARLPPLGLLRERGRRRTLPGQAPDGEAGPGAVVATAQETGRALGGGAGHGARHARPDDHDPEGKPVHLHPGRG